MSAIAATGNSSYNAHQASPVSVVTILKADASLSIHDVVFGRGMLAQRGNLVFRNTVLRKFSDFIKAPKRSDKEDQVAREVINITKSNGGRFLRRIYSHEFFENGECDIKAGDTAWITVSDHTVLRKVIQVFYDLIKKYPDYQSVSQMYSTGFTTATPSFCSKDLCQQRLPPLSDACKQSRLLLTILRQQQRLVAAAPADAVAAARALNNMKDGEEDDEDATMLKDGSTSLPASQSQTKLQEPVQEERHDVASENDCKIVQRHHESLAPPTPLPALHHTVSDPRDYVPNTRQVSDRRSDAPVLPPDQSSLPQVRQADGRGSIEAPGPDQSYVPRTKQVQHGWSTVPMPPYQGYLVPQVSQAGGAWSVAPPVSDQCYGPHPSQAGWSIVPAMPEQRYVLHHKQHADVGRSTTSVPPDQGCQFPQGRSQSHGRCIVVPLPDQQCCIPPSTQAVDAGSSAVAASVPVDRGSLPQGKPATGRSLAPAALASQKDKKKDDSGAGPSKKEVQFRNEVFALAQCHRSCALLARPNGLPPPKDSHPHGTVCTASAYNGGGTASSCKVKKSKSIPPPYTTRDTNTTTQHAGDRNWDTRMQHGQKEEQKKKLKQQREQQKQEKQKPKKKPKPSEEAPLEPIVLPPGIVLHLPPFIASTRGRRGQKKKRQKLVVSR